MLQAEQLVLVASGSKPRAETQDLTMTPLLIIEVCGVTKPGIDYDPWFGNDIGADLKSIKPSFNERLFK